MRGLRWAIVRESLSGRERSEREREMARGREDSYIILNCNPTVCLNLGAAYHAVSCFIISPQLFACA